MSSPNRPERVAFFANATNTQIHNATFNFIGSGRENGPTNTTDISVENVGNQNHSVHLHLQHTEIYQCSAHGENIRGEVADITDDEDQEEAFDVGEGYTNLSASLSKTLAMADKTENTRELRRAAHSLARLVSENPFMEEESNTDMEEVSSSRSRRRFVAGEGSPWNNAVQGVVDSVNVMSRCATSIGNHSDPRLSGAAAPPPPPFDFSPLSSAAPPRDLINAVQVAVVDAMQAQFSTEGTIPPASAGRTSHWPSSRVAPVRAFLGRSWRFLSASSSSVSASLPQLDDESSMPTAGAPEGPLTQKPALTTKNAAPAHSIAVPTERLMTIRPLLLPPDGKAIAAHRLASLYFTAVLDPRQIPEFKAEYVYDEGQCDSILLTFKNTYVADRLKEVWDSTDRENTGAPELATVSLYRGKISGPKMVDTFVRDAAIQELASYRFIPRSLGQLKQLKERTLRKFI